MAALRKPATARCGPPTLGDVMLNSPRRQRSSPPAALLEILERPRVHGNADVDSHFLRIEALE